MGRSADARLDADTGVGVGSARRRAKGLSMVAVFATLLLRLLL
jgi:hypothetical protein